MTFLAFTRHSQRQYLAEVPPQLTEKKSPAEWGFLSPAEAFLTHLRCCT